ncbi:MAG: DUF2298 domain-containing protein [Chloroflexota bacterium]
MSFAAANPPRERKIDLPLVGLAVTLLAAAGLRLYGVDWDAGHLFHPDERHILMVTDRIGLPWPPDLQQLLDPKSPLNPQSFAYGSLVFYLLKLVAQVASWLGELGGPLAQLTRATELDGLRIVGRLLSAGFDLGTVAMTFALGRRLYGQTVGLLGALFVAFSVIHIQLAHFYASDTLLTLFVVLVVFFSLRLMQGCSLRYSVLVGLALGLALATKVSGLPVVLALAAAHGLRLFTTAVEHERGATGLRVRLPSLSELEGAVLSLLITGLAAFAVFAIAEPYAIIDAKTFFSHLDEQNRMVRGVADLPYTRQYIDRAPYLYFVQNLSTWGVGLPLGIVMVGGTLFVLGRSLLGLRPGELVVLAWVLPYFLITGSFHAKFLRYLLPISPFFSLFAACLLVAMARSLSGRRHGSPLGVFGRVGGPFLRLRLPSGSVVGVGIVGLVIVATIFYALAFANIYSAQHPGVRASEWIYRNVPDGAHIAREHWEEGLPVTVQDVDGQHDPRRHGYVINTLNMYDQDNSAKLDHLVQVLGDSDYIVFYSQRLYGTLPRLPERYPLSQEYYRLLFSEQLGFRLEATFASYPNLLGVAFVDDTFTDPGLPTPAALVGFRPAPLTLDLGRADESFTVYDHPKVLVFKKQRQLSDGELRALLSPALPKGQSKLPPAPGDSPVALLSAERWQEMTAGGTFRELFDRNGPENRWPLAVWIVTVELIGLVPLPVTTRLLRGLPDGGFGLTRTLGLLLLAWITWTVVSLGLFPNTRITVFLALAVLIAANVAVFVRHRRSIIESLWAKRRVVVVGEVVFWGAFALFLAIRLANPDLWHPARGGEKPMDLAYLMAVMKSQWFPPYDPWFAGGYLNYYYFGQVIVGTLIKLTGIVPTTAFNLAIPLLFALTFAGVFSAAFNLVALREDGRGSTRAWTIAGLAGSGMALLLGNLGGGVQLGETLMRLSPLKLACPVGLDTAVGLVGGIWQAVTQPGGLNIPTDWYWASTRVIEGTINEFPFFTFLYADLHAHLIALPLTMLALGLALTLMTSLGAPMSRLTWQTSRRTEGHLGADGGPAGQEVVTAKNVAVTWSEVVALVFLSGLVVGSLAPTNFWDYPTYLLIVALAVVAPWYVHRPLVWSDLATRVAVIVVIGVLTRLLFWPYHANFQMFYFGIEAISDKSSVGDYLIIHGMLLFGVASFITVGIARHENCRQVVRLTGLFLRQWDRFSRLDALLRTRLPGLRENARVIAYLVLAGMAVLAALALLGLGLVSLLLAIVAAVAVVGLWSRPSATDAFILGLIALGAGLGIVCEFVAVKGDVGRMNTVFRFYLQVWMLWSIVGAVGLYTAVTAFKRSARRFGHWAWTAVLVGLLATCLVYPLVGTRARVADRFDPSIAPTLDGTAYMERAVYRDENHDLSLASDLAAIRWLQDNVEGSPVILEGRTPLYRWGSRISIYTGLPTVLGWDWHQKQQRAGYTWLVDQRAGDVSEMYGTLSTQRTKELLRKYQVRYVYVGGLERAYYPAEGLAKFDKMLNSDLRLVYDHDGVRIYEVLRGG